MSTDDLGMRAADAAGALMARYGGLATENGRWKELLQLAWLEGNRAANTESLDRVDAILEVMEQRWPELREWREND